MKGQSPGYIMVVRLSKPATLLTETRKSSELIKYKKQTVKISKIEENVIAPEQEWKYFIPLTYLAVTVRVSFQILGKIPLLAFTLSKLSFLTEVNKWFKLKAMFP